MAEFEVLQKSQSLSHAYISVDLKAHVCNRALRVHVTNDIFSDNVQTGCLLPRKAQKLGA